MAFARNHAGRAGGIPATIAIDCGDYDRQRGCEVAAGYAWAGGLLTSSAAGARIELLVSFPNGRHRIMKNFTAVIERDAETGLYVGWVPGFPGAHSQGATLDELRTNLQEVVEMLLEEGDPRLESEFIGTQTVEVA